MNLPLSTAFTISHMFWVVFSFSFVFMHILISSVICWLFRSMLFSLHMFVFLIVFFFSCSVQSVQLLSHVQLCNPMNHSMPGLPVHHQLPEFTQTHVHWVGNAIQPSHPLSSPSPPALNLGSQSYMEMRRGRREIEVTRRRRGGIRRGESSLASNQFPVFSPQSWTLREFHGVP